MTIPIKFRGVARGIRQYPKGKIYYGLYDDGWDVEAPCIFFKDDTNSWNFVPIEPDSVAQLIGYDKDGKEIYTGDVVISELGNKFTAELRPLVAKQTVIDEIINLDIQDFKLKKG